MYRSGAFDATLLAILENYQAVLDIILPTLGEARRQTYSRFCHFARKPDACSWCRSGRWM